MIISGTLQLDQAAHAAATTSLADRLVDLDARRRQAESAVEALLATWHGEAAAAFGDQWSAWSRAATAVVEQLAATVEAFPAAASDVAEADELGRAASEQLRGRLGARLP